MGASRGTSWHDHPLTNHHGFSRMNLATRLLGALMGLLLCVGALASEGGGGNNGPYMAIEPAIVVNLQSPGRPQFMQVRIQAMSHDPKVLEALKTHMGPVRDALITLLSAQTADAMYNIQQREQVRQQALEALRKVLEEHAGIKSGEGKEGPTGLEALYFTDFVIQ